jgi:hypothetical protein
MHASFRLYVFGKQNEKDISFLSSVKPDRTKTSFLVGGKQHLIGKHQHSLQREMAIAKVEEVLERRTKQIDYHHIVVAFDSKPQNLWQPDTTV